MSSQDFISVKKSPQFQLQFLKNAQMNSGSNIITFVAVTKLLVKQNGVDEDAENGKDFLALHVYNQSKVGEKTYNASNPLKKAKYRSEQTIMVRLKKLSYQKYAEQGTLLNLCLD